MATSSENLLGYMVTFGGRGTGNHPFSRVVDSLEKSGLDTKVARAFLPRTAWSRAYRKLADSRRVDVVREDAEEAVFQFSSRSLVKDESDGGQQIAYRKDFKILLDKESGGLRCQDTDTLLAAKAELERCIVERTPNDVTLIVRKLFTARGDLMPLPNCTGVYFVPLEQGDFLKQIETFLGLLGRKPYCFPIPKGTDADSSVRDTVTVYLEGMIEELVSSIEKFSESTRNGTMEAAGEKIKNARAKIEGYATYLQERKDYLLSVADTCEETLRETIERLTGVSETLPVAVEEEPEAEPVPAAARVSQGDQDSEDEPF